MVVLPPSLTVAAIQMDCALQHVAENLSHSHRLLEEAADQGAALAVLPELFSTGFALYKDALLHAEPIDGPLVGWMRAQAMTLDLAVVGSLVERDRKSLHLTTVLVDQRGVPAVHRRVALSSQEDLFFSAGQGVHTASVGELRVGLLAGRDLQQGRLVSSLRNQGTQVLCSGSAATDAASYGASVEHAAREGGFYHVAANRIGDEAELHYCGGTRVVGPDGDDLASVADGVEGVAVAALPLVGIRSRD